MKSILRAALLSWYALLAATVCFSETSSPEHPNAATPTAPIAGVPGRLPDKTKQAALRVFSGGPLRFEVNAGQFDPQVKFASRGAAHGLFLTPEEAVFVLSRPATMNKEARWNPRHRFDNQPVNRTVARLRLVHANPVIRIEGLDELSSRSNYLLGQDPRAWHAGVENFARVRYHNVYPGIDWMYYGNDGRLEYDFVVAPGADPAQVMLDIAVEGSSGAEAVLINEDGDLVLDSRVDGIRFLRPVAYQIVDGERQLVSANYTMKSPGRVGFELGPYNPARELVIDPVLIFSTYLGGAAGNAAGFSVAVDSTGIYVAGQTDAGNFPTTTGALQETPGSGTTNCFSAVNPNPCFDAFVSKLSLDGSTLIYSTYLGGGARDGAFGIGVDGIGRAIVTGSTHSSDFPTQNALQPNIAPGTCQASNSTNITCEDAFLAVLNDVGSALVYSTYLGGAGNDYGNAVAVDLAGNAYVTGFTESDLASFPATSGSPGGGTCTDNTSNFPCGDAFVAKLNPNLVGAASRFYAMFLGGNGDDFGNSIAVDTLGNAFVAGPTIGNISGGNSFPITAGFQASFNGSVDGFLAKIPALGPPATYSTFLGGNDDDQILGIAIESTGRALVTGYTLSTNFPTKGAVQTTLVSGTPCNFTNHPCYDAFIAKVDTGIIGLNSLVYSTYLGGSDDDRAVAIAVDSFDNVYVSGATGTPQTGVTKPFPLVLPIQSAKNGVLAEFDGFVSKLNNTGTALTFSTYFGGGGDFDLPSSIQIGPAGEIVIAGRTNSGTLPITLDAFEPTPQGISDDAFVARIDTANSPAAAFSAAGVDFGSIAVGSTSAVQSITLLNMGTAALNISSATITGTNAADFDTAPSTTCGSSVAAASFCFFDLTFSPSLAVAHNAFLTVADNAGGTPHNVALTGTGGAGFSMTAAGSSITVDPGQTASYTLTLTPLGGFNQSISFSCSGNPIRSTCTPPANTTLDGANPTDVTLRVVTQARSAAPPSPKSPTRPPSPSPENILLWSLGLLALLVLISMARGRRTQLALTTALLVVLVATACGGGGGGGGSTPTGTPAGTYTITATATSGTITKTTTLTLVVR